MPARPPSPPPAQDERSLSQLAADRAPGRAPVPEGGWVRAASRAASSASSNRTRPYFESSLYLTHGDVLPQTYTSFEDAACQKQHGHAEEHQAGPPDGLPADQCCIAWDETVNKLWVWQATSDANSVEYRNLGQADKKTFDKARNKEVQGLLDLNAYRILSLEESLAFRDQHPDCVLPSRFVDRWKGTDEGGVKPPRTTFLGNLRNIFSINPNQET